MSAAVLGFRVLVGALLLLAGVLKIGHPSQLAESIAGFRLLPPAVVGPLALALPYFEILLGLYLLAGLFTRVVAVIAAVQFGVYAGAIASAIVRHLTANCGCFGPNDAAPPGWAHVIFDLGLAGAAVFIACGAPGALALDRPMRRFA